jgi:signal transduction histidine kinase
MQKRITAFFLIILTIVAGLLSRRFTTVPLWMGDLFYAEMMYFILRFIFLRKRPFIIFIACIVVCFCIEFSQLYHSQWIDNIRATVPGHLILGRGFLWSDLIAYLAGSFVGLCLDWALKMRHDK